MKTHIQAIIIMSINDERCYAAHTMEYKKIPAIYSYIHTFICSHLPPIILWLAALADDQTAASRAEMMITQ